MFMPRTYRKTSCVVVTGLIYVRSVSIPRILEACTGLQKQLKGAHGVDGGQCFLILSSTLD